jgi:hypothetical protein
MHEIENHNFDCMMSGRTWGGGSISEDTLDDQNTTAAIAAVACIWRLQPGGSE